MRNNSRVKLVLGNGFDLFCGLKTKYIDFFKSEKRKYDEIKKWRNFFIGKEGNLDVYIKRSSFNWEKLWEQLPNESECNIWDIYFVLEIGENDYKWCDIEAEMLKTFINHEKKFNWDTVFSIVCNRNYDDELDHEILMAAYIIHKAPLILTWADFYVFLLQELNKFEKNFGEYVRNEYETNYEDKVLPNAKKIIDFFENEGLGKIVSTETFNYTDNNIKRESNGISIFDTIHHINGNYNNPIFGIDSSKIKVESPIVFFTKVARRMQGLTQINNDSFLTFGFDFDTLIIFGHSLNEHDYSYFFPIFDYLDMTNITKNTALVFAYYIYDEEKRNIILLDLTSRIIRIIDAYESYAGVKKAHRLIDSLTAQGRIILKEIPNS